jgi:ABC-type multidrug transport system fused ATPase/permease subunit
MERRVASDRVKRGRAFLTKAARARWRRQRQQLRTYFRVGLRLFPHVYRRRGRLLVTLSATMGLMLVRLLEPWPLKLIFDHVLLEVPLPRALSFLDGWAGGDRVLLLAMLVVSIVLVALLSGLLYYQQNVRAARLGQEVAAELRLDLYSHLHRLSFSFHDRRRTGDLIVRLVQDIRMLRDAVVKLPLELAENSLLILGMGLILLVMDWQLALLAFALLPVLAVVVRTYRKPMKAAIRKQRRQEGDLATVASDSLGAIRAVQGFRLEHREVRRFGGANRRSLKHGVRAARLEAKLRWSSDVAVGVVTALVVGFAARRILSGALSPGDLIVFVTYLRAFARPLRRVSRTTERVARTAAAAERVLEIMDREPEVRDLPQAREAPRFRGEILFDRVSLRHGRHPWVLRDVSLRVRSGEVLGIVGPTGAGKSSLISLVPRFYDPSEGCVRVDGIDLRSMTLDSLRAQVSLVFQEPILFAATVAENIAGGSPDAGRDEVVEAARRAGIHPVIESLPEGYDTVLGERGGTLSGGERQCVAVARAMLRDAPIVILDEPTTGLDLRNAALVIEALQRLVEERTVLLISHELTRLKDVDRIVVIEDGRIVEEGSYDQLATGEGLFRQLKSYGR